MISVVLMEFDLTDATTERIVTVPAGRYVVKTGEWRYYVKEATGNRVVRVPLLVDGGRYNGVELMFFYTANPEKRASRNELLRILSALGVITEKDRGKDGKLSVKLAFDVDDVDDRGHILVSHAVVNGKKRKLDGRNAVADVITIDREYQDDTGTTRSTKANRVDEVLPADTPTGVDPTTEDEDPEMASGFDAADDDQETEAAPASDSNNRKPRLPF